MPLRLLALTLLLAASPAMAQAPLVDSADYRLELDGPATRCGLPARFTFGTNDVITHGKVTIGGRFYFPRGRLQTETRQLDMALVRWDRADDPAPVLKIRAVVDGTLNGEWTGRRQGCRGKVTVVVRG
jgi:hypothetical protein